MLNNFAQILGEAYKMLGYPFDMFGFEISFLNVIIWSAVASLIIWFFNEVKS
ncbi:MAG: hypothetical protein FWD90_12295 [Defluviitaleaceae bacterium]|nr:hypothetical protein [Defluviitaleaceae bacterium]